MAGFQLSINGRFWVSTEDAFGASLAQIARSRGGFVEARVAATRRLDFTVGAGTDRLYDRGRFPGNLIRNDSAFGNAIFRLTPEIATSLEYRWLATTPRVGARRENHHYDFTMTYTF